MAKQYYLVASLPPLVLGETPPISPDQFLAQCEGILSVGELEDVGNLLRGEICVNMHSPAARAWCAKEIQLRNAVARIRATRRHTDPRSLMRDHAGFDATIEKMVTDAFARSNPLDVELALDHGRWRLAEDFSLGDQFGIERVMAYAVQLRLAQRWADLDPDRGRERLETTVEQQARTANQEIGTGREEGLKE